MKVIDQGGLPQMPPGSNLRFRHRRGNGFWSRFGQAGLGMQLNILGSAFGLLLIVGYLVWRFILPHSNSTAQAAEPTAAIATVAPLVTPLPADIAAAGDTSAQSVPTSPLEPAQISATATAHFKYSQPAVVNPATMPYFIGVITYEPGCSASNVGFTTSGYEGQGFYLYLQQPLDRDPLMQMAQISGYVQEMQDCPKPVIMVQQLTWLNLSGTPAPLPVVVSGTITSTEVISWGLAAHGLPTPDKSLTPVYNPPAWTATPVVTIPTATPYVPPVPPTLAPLPTYTRQPTYTPYPSPTNNPATPTATMTSTPQPANISGPVVAVAGCPATNLAIQTGPGQTVFLLFAGATLPVTGSPVDYHALVIGTQDRVCSGPAIRASAISWYVPTATPTPTVTPTATETLTPTPTDTAEPPTATLEPPTATAEVTPEVLP